MRQYMLTENELICPNCGSDKLIHYDTVKRIVRTKSRKKKHVQIRRMRCKKCKRIHRELPSYIYPYKQYEAEIIKGVLEGYITSDTLGYENYPCETTMRVWITHIFHSPL